VFHSKQVRKIKGRVRIIDIAGGGCCGYDERMKSLVMVIVCAVLSWVALAFNAQRPRRNIER